MKSQRFLARFTLALAMLAGLTSCNVQRSPDSNESPPVDASDLDSLEDWCKAASSLPEATQRTIEVLLERAETRHCQVLQFKLERNEKLILRDENLSDVRPLQYLKHLKSLSLAGNSIYDIAPLQDLTDLKSLSISGNPVQDFTPLQHLTDLESLSLVNTQIRDFAFLPHLTRLKFLNLDKNQIRHLPPISSLSQLERLSLDDNLLEDITGLQGFPNLEVVSASRNKITKISSFKDCPNLYKVFLNDNQIEDLTPLDESDLEVSMLYLENNKIQDISPLQNVEVSELYLSSNLVRDLSPLVGTGYAKLDLSYNQIRNLPPLKIQVRQLHLDNNQIEDLRPLEALDRPERLVDLTVTGNQIRQLPSFAEMTDLTYLDLSDNQIEDIRPLATWVYDRERWQRMMTNPRSGLLMKFYRELHLENNQITDLSPLEDFEQPDSLTTLTLKGNQIRQLPSFSGMTCLNFLDLSDNQIEDVSPLQSLETPQGWQISIKLRNNRITDAQPLSLVSRIYVLDLKGNPLVDETCPLPDLEERNCRL